MSRQLIITGLPGRVKKALCVVSPGLIEPLAYFKDEAAIKTFLSFYPVYDDQGGLGEIKNTEISWRSS